ncbi:MAG: 4Fe-4S dicluster domain-containing protein [Deltaproteobacteria bacterium]|nr:4Fe-4S dicluster domain-containing protein [Deltaproteobacteria bacterium]MBI4224241.1 4Fe-4S dicluster domain-containing protein [Deltaproteobacteria bacterium]
MTSPSQYPPPYQAADFVARPSKGADKQLSAGVLIVGAGPAGLACAIRLGQLLKESPEVAKPLGEFPIALLEKGKYPGAHLVSGAVINPIAFRQLFPGLKDSDFPFAGAVQKEAVYFLTAKGAVRLPTPPTMQNHGNYVASLSKVGAWLAKQAEGLGVTILSETAGYKLLVDDGKVVGAQTGDKGRDRNGQPLSNFEEGIEMLAQATVLAEGTQGHLTQTAIEHFNLKGANPQIYALGVKEIWEVPKSLDRVVHTMGWPLRPAKKYGEFGGSFAYPLGPNKISLGLVIGLDYHDATLSVHDLFQEMKRHPLFQKILEGGRRLDKGWGAKTIPEGGFYALPRQLHLPGCLLTGDAAGFVNVPALKGIHYAMTSGMLAAEAIVEALRSRRDLKAPHALQSYDQKIRRSFIWKDLRRVRNMRQAFQWGFWPGFFLAGLMTVTRGLFPGWRFKTRPDYEQPLFNGDKKYPKPDGKYTFDKLASAFASGNRSRDNQPNHIRVMTEVPETVGEAWIHMCPANVYEWHTEGGQKKIHVNATNCIHCGAISAKGGRLTPPEGGSGPEYTET